MINNTLIVKIQILFCMLLIPFIVLSNEKTNYPDEFIFWLNYYNLDMNHFQKTDVKTEDFMDWQDYNLDSSFLEMYEQLFIFSPNEKFFLDLDTYSVILERIDNKLYLVDLGIDTEIKLVTSDRKKYSRIFFCGSACIPETAYWISNSTFEVAGFELDENNNAMPVRWQFNFDTRTTIIFKNVEVKLDSIEEYLVSVRLKRINDKNKEL